MIKNKVDDFVHKNMIHRNTWFCRGEGGGDIQLEKNTEPSAKAEKKSMKVVFLFSLYFSLRLHIYTHASCLC